MENHYVTYKMLKKGQQINGTKEGNRTSAFTAYVVDINPNFVTVEMWNKGGDRKQISTHEYFAVPMTEKEFNLKYLDKAKEVIKNIDNKLYKDQIGYHEMWNSWLFGSAFEVASACIKNDINIVGYCSDITPKINYISNEPLNIGVCAEYSDGERFWCHFSTTLVEDMKSLFEYEVNKLNN